MNRWGVLAGLLLLSFPSLGESLAQYYLKFVLSENLFSSLVKVIYVFTGIGSLFNLAMIFKALSDEDHHAAKKAQQWCLSLVLVAGLTFFIATLVGDARTGGAVNVGSALAKTTSGLKASYSTISNLVYVVCGMIGLLVLPGKFRALQSGDREAGKSITSWGTALVAVSVITYFLHLMYF